MTGLTWGYKLVGTDLCTDDKQGGRFRYRLGEWHDADPGARTFTTAKDCPQFPGDGLCIARNLRGACSGGARVGASVMLLVGYHPTDVLNDSGSKIRVKRLYVHPDPHDPVRLLTGPGSDLSGSDLSGSDLRGSNLSDSNLRCSNLRCSNLSGSNLRGSNLSDSNLRCSNLSGSDLRCSDLRGSNLRGSDLSGSDLRGSNLSGSDLRCSDLRGSNLRYSNLSGSNLSGSDLSGSDLRYSNLSGSDLSGSDLRGSDLRGSDLRGSYGNARTVLPAGWVVNGSGLIVRTP